MFFLLLNSGNQFGLKLAEKRLVPVDLEFEDLVGRLEVSQLAFENFLHLADLVVLGRH